MSEHMPVDPFAGAVDLSEVGKPPAGFDPSQLPDVFRGEFTNINFDFLKETMHDGSTRILFSFYPPLLPFIKFRIPFQGSISMRNFAENAMRAAEVLEELEAIEAMETENEPEAVDNGVPPEATT